MTPHAPAHRHRQGGRARRRSPNCSHRANRLTFPVYGLFPQGNAAPGKAAPCLAPRTQKCCNLGGPWRRQKPRRPAPLAARPRPGRTRSPPPPWRRRAARPGRDGRSDARQAKARGVRSKPWDLLQDGWIERGRRLRGNPVARGRQQEPCPNQAPTDYLATPPWFKRWTRQA